MLLTTVILTAAISVGQSKPTPAQAKAVIDHYYNGSDPILVESVLCKTVEKKDKKNKYNCIETYGSTANKGDLVYVHLLALVPQNVKATYMIQSAHEGVVRSTKDVELNSSLRNRTWKGFGLQKAGKWTFKILDKEGNTLKKMSIEATED